MPFFLSSCFFNSPHISFLVSLSPSLSRILPFSFISSHSHFTLPFFSISHSHWHSLFLTFFCTPISHRPLFLFLLIFFLPAVSVSFFSPSIYHFLLFFLSPFLSLFLHQTFSFSLSLSQFRSLLSSQSLALFLSPFISFSHLSSSHSH